eukprot:207063-Pleurochrysis_carterae.AAC.1
MGFQQEDPRAATPKRGEELSAERGPRGVTHATANANGKGGWGQKVCGNGVRGRENFPGSERSSRW